MLDILYHISDILYVFNEIFNILNKTYHMFIKVSYIIYQLSNIIYHILLPKHVRYLIHYISILDILFKYLILIPNKIYKVSYITY